MFRLALICAANKQKRADHSPFRNRVAIEASPTRTKICGRKARASRAPFYQHGLVRERVHGQHQCKVHTVACKAFPGLMSHFMFITCRPRHHYLIACKILIIICLSDSSAPEGSDSRNLRYSDSSWMTQFLCAASPPLTRK